MLKTLFYEDDGIIFGVDRKHFVRFQTLFIALNTNVLTQTYTKGNRVIYEHAKSLPKFEQLWLFLNSDFSISVFGLSSNCLFMVGGTQLENVDVTYFWKPSRTLRST